MPVQFGHSHCDKTEIVALTLMAVHSVRERISRAFREAIWLLELGRVARESSLKGNWHAGMANR